jgi:hypothetical protein
LAKRGFESPLAPLKQIRGHLNDWQLMLAYYRSQHANQSWLAALTTIMDVSALTMLSGHDDLKHPAGFTFAYSRASNWRHPPISTQLSKQTGQLRKAAPFYNASVIPV